MVWVPSPRRPAFCTTAPLIRTMPTIWSAGVPSRRRRGTVAFLTFLEFCTEDYADALSVYDGPDDSFPALVSDKSGCSEPIGDDDILSNGTRLYIYFSSDSSVTLSGFAIQWTFIPGRFPTVTLQSFRSYLDISPFFISS